MTTGRDYTKPDETVDPSEAVRANNELWDEWTQIHERSEFYDLEGFKRDTAVIRLSDHEREEIGDVRGLSVLHLQCHFGIDSLSWARLGANVTGADFSQAAIDLATKTAAEIGLGDQARFVRSDLFELPNVLEGEFDLVYTSRGVLGWMPDIRRWAEVVAHFVRPGGRFYITEIHPIAQVFENEGVAPGELQLVYPYWEHRAPLAFDNIGSYADPDAPVTVPKEFGWDHGLGEIVTALIEAGLRIESLREYPFLPWKLDFLEQSADGSWRLPESAKGQLPLSFSILASKPQ
ncbi:MAG TPA: class I SAM-dependent methyltransferase [Candidatus Limnocylindrales bacterium]|nr:class I SAM-dependent methyltransferase [Candidatus Limnocylindrales bacterium]